MTRHHRRTAFNTIIVAVLALACAAKCGAIELDNSFFEADRQQLKYQYATTVLAAPTTGQALLTTFQDEDFGPGDENQKSPFKAFLLSAAVPGLGQYYYGSRVKPFVFLGAEVAVWGLYAKWHGNGRDLESQYEAFNNEHWLPASYADYLEAAYGVRDDDLIDATEVTHHLPSEQIQQYFEMTGKYDQFAWGWDDARREGLDLEDYVSTYGTSELAITTDERAPSSANRVTYEDMRDDSNRKFDHATKMIMASIANRLISAFEAYFTTKALNSNSHKKAGARSQQEFGEFKFKASLKSYHTKRDTPYLKVTYKF